MESLLRQQSARLDPAKKGTNWEDRTFTICLYEWRTGKLIWIYRGLPTFARALCFSPSGKDVAVGMGHLGRNSSDAMGPSQGLRIPRLSNRPA